MSKKVIFGSQHPVVLNAIFFSNMTAKHKREKTKMDVTELNISCCGHVCVCVCDQMHRRPEGVEIRRREKKISVVKVDEQTATRAAAGSTCLS